MAQVQALYPRIMVSRPFDKRLKISLCRQDGITGRRRPHPPEAGVERRLQLGDGMTWLGLSFLQNMY
jgi:hypothetical protein